MGRGMCGRPIAALALLLLGAPLAVGMDRQDGVEAENTRFDSQWALGAVPCPTRFDYLVLASFADAPSLLGLSSYHFRSELGYSRIPLTGTERVDFKPETEGADCRSSWNRRV